MAPESGARAGYDGHKEHKGSKLHLAVATLRQLLAAIVTPANEQERAQVAALATKVQEAAGDTVEVAFVDQGYTGEQAAEAADQHGIRLEVVKLPTTKHGFTVLPRRWVVDMAQQQGASYGVYRFGGRARSQGDVRPWSLLLKATGAAVAAPNSLADLNPSDAYYWKREILT